MDYEWDENKRIANIRKHGLDFIDAPQVFDDPYVFWNLDRRYTDERWLLIGKLRNFITVVIAYTEPNPDKRRIISMRAATSDERDQYEKERAARFFNDPLYQLLVEMERKRKSAQASEGS